MSGTWPEPPAGEKSPADGSREVNTTSPGSWAPGLDGTAHVNRDSSPGSGGETRHKREGKRRCWPKEVKERVFALAKEGYGYYKIWKMLKSEGLDIPLGTIRKWTWKNGLGVWRRVPKEIKQKALDLHANGLGPKAIWMKLREEGIDRSFTTVVRWVSKQRRKLKRRRRKYRDISEFLPTWDLGFIIGAVVGDGSVICYFDKLTGHRRRCVRLVVTQETFARAFAKSASNLYKYEPHIREVFYNDTKYFVVEITDTTLYKLLEGKNLEVLQPLIEANDDIKAGFLRGLFDAEGYVGEKDVRLSNTDYQLLVYTQNLLADFQIETTGPYLTHRGGAMHVFKGRPVVCRKDCYYIRVRPDSLQLFLQKVGFSIPYKQQKLEDLVKRNLIRKTRQLQLAMDVP